MRHLFLVATAIVALAFNSLAQDEKGFSFQGIARDLTGAAYGASTIKVRFTLKNADGESQYQEEQTITTDAFGVFAAVIGSVTPAIFATVDFSEQLTVMVELATTGSYATLTEYELQSVPYAKYAAKADTTVTAINGCPPGSVMAYAGKTIPSGWLLCNGTLYDGTNATYAALYTAIGLAWGGSGTSFRVPDLRGAFLRGVDAGRGMDDNASTRNAFYSGGNAGDAVGSYEGCAIQSHTHTYSPWNVFSTVKDYEQSQAGSPDNWGYWDSGTTGATGGAETRPENYAVYYIIKL